MTVKETITKKLRQGLEIDHIEVVDDSGKHAGHVGARPEGETHFTVHIVSPVFDGMTRIDRQRVVLDLLKDELAGPVHALVIKALSPAQAAQSS